MVSDYEFCNFGSTVKYIDVLWIIHSCFKNRILYFLAPQ